MTDSLFLQTDMFTLNTSRGVGALIARDLEDIGVTKRDGRFFDRNGRRIEDFEERPARASLLRDIIAYFAPRRARAA